MAVYKHGVYVTEQPTGVVAPVQSTAGLQVVIGTAPINRASDPYHCTNTPMLANTLKGATAAVGYSDDYDKYTICQSMGACFKVMGVAPVILINVLDPNKHKKDMAETTVQVNSGVATVEQKDILLDKLVVKSASTTLTAGTDYTAAFDDDGYVTIAIIPGGKAASATSLTVSGVQIDPDAVTAADIVGGVNAKGVETGMEVIRQIYLPGGAVKYPYATGPEYDTMKRDFWEDKRMNIQIFGTSKCFDTKKAQRYFKERGIRFQMIDLKEKEMSRGEFENVARALGGWQQLVNPAAKDKQTLALLDALVDWQKEDKLFENQQLFKTPIVRNGRKATVGYQPDVWKTWE